MFKNTFPVKGCKGRFFLIADCRFSIADFGTSSGSTMVRRKACLLRTRAGSPTVLTYRAHQSNLSAKLKSSIPFIGWSRLRSNTVRKRLSEIKELVIFSPHFSLSPYLLFLFSSFVPRRQSLNRQINPIFATTI